MPHCPEKIVFQHVSNNFKSYNIPSKVAQSAKLLGITGSPAQRKKIAAEMHAQFFSELDKVAHERTKLNQTSATLFTDIQAQLKKMVPDIKVQLEAVQGDRNPCVILDDKYVKSVVDSFIIKADFDSAEFGLHIKRSNSSQNNSLHHEMSHFFNFITEPKTVARAYHSEIGSLNSDFEHGFYKKVLYTSNPNINNLDVVETLKFYSGQDKNKSVENFEKEIKEFIKYSFFSPKEKIDMLQNWRYALDSEKDAFTLGAVESANRDVPLYESLLVLLRGGDVKYTSFDEKGVCKKLSTEGCGTLNEKGWLITEERKKLAKFYTHYYNDCVFQFPEKIKAVENVLKEELFKQRSEHKSLIEKMAAKKVLQENNLQKLNQVPVENKQKKSWFDRFFKV